MYKKYTNLVYLVRHGENPANVHHIFSYKKVDYSLTPKGRLQAQQTGEYFVDKPIDEIYASPLKRARETGECIAQAVHLPVTIVEQFREINVGTLEDQPPSEESWGEHNRIVHAWFNGQNDESFPGGENYYQLLERFRDGLRLVTQGKEGKRIVIAGHGGMFTRTLRDICPGLDITPLLSRENHNCSITPLELTTEGENVTGKMLQWASIEHLYGDAAELIPGTLLAQPDESDAVHI